MADYSAVAGPGLAFAGVDQGIDFTGAGDVYVPFGAVVTRVQPSGSGWPGQGAVINVKLLEGPAAGHYLYYSEDLVPVNGLRVGSRVPAGTKIAYATGSGLAPGIEVGWAQPSGIPLAPRPPARPADQHTPQGASFDSFISAVSSFKHEPGIGSVASNIGQGIIDAGTGNPIGAAGDVLGGAASHIPGVSQLESVGGFLGKLTDPHYILRGLQIVAGAGLATLGAVLLVRQVALAQNLPDPLVVLAQSGERRERRTYESLRRGADVDLRTNRARAQGELARRRAAEADRAEARNRPAGDLPAGY